MYLTFALTLIKGQAGKRDDTHQYLIQLAQDSKFLTKAGISIEKVFISFGWPDFILLLHAGNVELLKLAIAEIQLKLAQDVKDSVETSSIVCTTKEELEKNVASWGKLLS